MLPCKHLTESQRSYSTEPRMQQKVRQKRIIQYNQIECKALNNHHKYYIHP